MAKKENKTISETVENVKEEAKEYYKWKNMTVRYIILWFLVILLIIQIILPRKLKNQVNSKNVNNINDVENIIETQHSTFEFLWENINVEDMDTLEKIKFDRAVHEITSNDIWYVYKISQLCLPIVQEIFKEYDIPNELSYLAIMPDEGLLFWRLSEFTQNKYWIINNEEVMESFNLKKMTEATAKYFNSLYKKYKDRYYVVTAYSMPTHEDGLDAELISQNHPNSSEFYNISGDEEYYRIMWYSYIFQNLWDYVNLDETALYDQIEIKTIEISEIKDLVKRAKKNKYSYKEIKELNPRILWNSLSKWKREIKLLK